MTDHDGRRRGQPHIDRLCHLIPSVVANSVHGAADSFTCTSMAQHTFSCPNRVPFFPQEHLFCAMDGTHDPGLLIVQPLWTRSFSPLPTPNSGPLRGINNSRHAGQQRPPLPSYANPRISWHRQHFMKTPTMGWPTCTVMSFIDARSSTDDRDYREQATTLGCSAKPACGRHARRSEPGDVPPRGGDESGLGVGAL